MGPSMIVDGDLTSACGGVHPNESFNGAVDDRRRRRLRTTPSPRSPASFNGAVDDRRRRRRRRVANHAAGVLASMGPSMIVDGDWTRTAPPRTGRASFNGAVDDRRRRRYGPNSFMHWGLASMGPSMIVDGDTKRTSRDSRLKTLQWGRR